MAELQDPHFWIVDDSSPDIIIFKETLNRIGERPRLRELSDGEILLDELERGKNGELPDVIFLDICMRRVNGKSALQTIRADTRYDNVYIVMQTVSYKEKNECITLGANAFISKSTDFPTYFKKLSSVMAEWQASI